MKGVIRYAWDHPRVLVGLLVRDEQSLNQVLVYFTHGYRR